MCWLMRRNFRIPSEEEMRRMVTPENVCSLLLLPYSCSFRLALEKDMSQAHNHYFHQYIEICVPVLLIE